VRHQIGQPGGVVDVGLAPRHVLDVGGVGQRQLEFAIGEDMPNRLPINTGGLHDNVSHAVLGQPLRQRQQSLGCGLEGMHLCAYLALSHVTHTGHHGFLMNV
jgi:hypothetical protein